MYILYLVLIIVNYGNSFTDDDNKASVIIISREAFGDITRQFIRSAITLGFRVQQFNYKNTDTAYLALSMRNDIIVNLHAEPLCEVYKYLQFMNTNLMYLGDDIRNLAMPNQECSRQKYIRLFSDTIIQYNRLYNMILQKNYVISDSVVICLPTSMMTHDKPPNDQYYNEIQIGFQYDCDKHIEVKQSTIAIITCSELKISTDIPTIFYDLPFLSPGCKDIIPNSMYLLKSWEPTVYAMRHFLKAMYWYRVGIISDSSTYSQKYLMKLIRLLEEDGFVYNSQECFQDPCDFTTGLQKLKLARARIILVNINPENAETFIDNIEKVNMQEMTWVVRNWPFHRLTLIKYGEVFSLTLNAAFHEYNNDVPYMNAINKSFDIVKQSYIAAHGDLYLFKRKFMERAQSFNQTYDNIVHVFRNDHNRGYKETNQVILTMKITGDQVTENINHITAHKSDLPDECLVRSSHFDRPCDHEVLALLVSVIVMFIFISLIILIFFTTVQRGEYNRFF